MATITSTAGVVIRPALVLGYKWRTETRRVLHPLVGSASPAVTVRPAALRSGTLRLFFLTEDEAIDAELVHSLGNLLTFEDPDRPGVGMIYSPGTVDVELDMQTVTRWIVSVEFQEVRQ